MNIYTCIKILADKVNYLITIPVVSSLLMFIITINQPQQYATTATIFTGITSNNSITNMSNNRVDFFATQNAYNNILSILLSKSVLEETSLKLLTSHLMLTKAEKGIISETSFIQLQKEVPEKIKNLIVDGDFLKSYNNIKNSVLQDKQNFIYGIINYDHPFYSIKALSKITAERLGSSDLIQISYKTTDPGICYNTVRILNEVFIEKYNNLQSSQTNFAVEYFEKQLKKAANKLKDAEDRLLVFNSTNEIINYYEQTKHISSQQEKIEVKLQDIQLEYNAAEAVLLKLENETKNRFDVNLRNKEILEIRNKLINITDKLAIVDLESKKNNEVNMIRLSFKKNNLEDKLKNKIDSMNIYSKNSQGIELKKILGDWLNVVIEFESARARLFAMKEKKTDFMKLYRKYAPLGAKLKRIEREIKVDEGEYLETLHHLGLARLKQQNAEMQSNMKIMDKPSLPINVIASKRKVYIILIGIFSLVFYVLALFIFELLDKRVKNTVRLAKHSSTEVVGAFCIQKGFSNYYLQQLTNRSAKYIIENILLHQVKTSEKKPIIIQLISNWNNEGKSFVGNAIYSYFSSIDKSVLYLNFSSDITENENHTSIKEKGILDYHKYLSEKHTEKYNSSDFIISELPPVSENFINPELMQNSDINYLVVEALRTWSDADDFLINKLKITLNNNLHSVLTKVRPDDAEEIFGEMPKKRSVIRNLIKNKIFKRFI